jgi:peptide deformylase
MELRQWGDPVLRTPTVAVSAFDGELRRLAAGMRALLEEVAGAGLAAPQVGSVRRLFVWRFEEGPIRTLVNPHLGWAAEETQLGVEGCLSIPGIALEVERAQAVTLHGHDLDGVELSVSAEGPDAVVLQHELDHLDGVLMLDRAAPAERRQALRVLRERVSASAG